MLARLEKRKQLVSKSEFNHKKEQQRAISLAFDGVCHELGISMLGGDVWKRERLAQLILRLVNEGGELDSGALQKQAVVQFISGAGGNSSPTTASAVKDT